MFGRPLGRLISCSLACLALVAGSYALVSQALAQTKLTVGIPAFYEGFLPVYAARDLGYFAEEGLDLEIITFKGGGAAGQAFAAGSIDLCLCSFDHVLKLQEHGLDAVAIGGIEEYNAYSLIARKGRIDGVADLTGKTIGITTPGSATDIAVRYTIRKAGLDPRDVTLISIGGSSAMKAALENEQVDAGMVIGGILVDMLATGDWDPIVDFRKERYPLEVTIARRAWLEKNGDLARRFLRAMTRAQDLLQRDPEAAYTATKAMFPKMDEKIVRGVSEAGVQRLSPDGTIHPEGVATITEWQLFAEAISKPIPYEELVDLSYLPAK